MKSVVCDFFSVVIILLICFNTSAQEAGLQSDEYAFDTIVQLNKATICDTNLLSIMDNMNSGSRWASNPNSSYEKWPRNGNTKDKINYLRKNVPEYKDLQDDPLNSPAEKRLKNDKFYLRPYSSYGKSIQKTIVVIIDTLIDYKPPTEDVLYLDVLKNDTIFGLIIDNSIIEFKDTNIYLRGGWWLLLSNDTENIVFKRFRKTHSSNANGKLKELFFEANCVMKMTRLNRYNKDYELEEFFFSIGHISYASRKIEKPKRKMKKRILNAYKQHQHLGL